MIRASFEFVETLWTDVNRTEHGHTLTLWATQKKEKKQKKQRKTWKSSLFWVFVCLNRILIRYQRKVCEKSKWK